MKQVNMNSEAALAIIRLHLKQCPGCGHDVSAGVACPERGNDMAGPANRWFARSGGPRGAATEW